MEIEITFPGGKRVDAHFGDTVVRTDQPAEAGGEGSAPAPFDLFLASLATCAGFYVLAFCQARGLPTDGLRVIQHVENDPKTHRPTAVDIDITLPVGLPEKYRPAILRAADHCKVKAVLAAPPIIRVHAVDPEELGQARAQAPLAANG